MLVLTSILITFLTLGHTNGSDELLDYVFGVESQADNIIITRHPYYAGIENSAECGAAIISTKFLLTTAQCGITIREGSHVYVGGNTVKRSEEKLIKHVILKDGCDWPTWYEGAVNDLALIMIDGELELKNTVNTIKLPRRQPPPSGYNYTMVFRMPSEGTQTEHLKQEKDLYAFPAVNCYNRTEFSKNYYKEHNVTAKELKEMNEASVCAVIDPDKGWDVCESNPGSLLVKSKTLYGLGSYRYHFRDCRKVGNFFTNIESYISWIDKTMKKAEKSPPRRFMVEE